LYLEATVIPTITFDYDVSLLACRNGCFAYVLVTAALNRSTKSTVICSLVIVEYSALKVEDAHLIPKTYIYNTRINIPQGIRSFMYILGPSDPIWRPQRRLLLYLHRHKERKTSSCSLFA
jgi:hypothetical protein